VYNYVGNNPVMYVDIMGYRNYFKKISDAVSGAVSTVGGAFSDLQDYAERVAQKGVAGAILYVNRVGGKYLGNSILGDVFRYTVGSAVATVALGMLITVAPTAFFIDPAWTVSNVMVAFNFTPVGLMVNYGVTGILSGKPRLPELTKFNGRYVEKNSMYGYIGSFDSKKLLSLSNVIKLLRPGGYSKVFGPGGYTPGPISFVSPGASDSLIQHETGHQMQYEQHGGWYMLKEWPEDFPNQNDQFECEAGKLSGSYSSAFPEAYCIAHGYQ